MHPEHTPGPWEFRMHAGWLISINTPGDGEGFPGWYLAEIHGEPARHEQNVANARLIAAAPETAEERNRLREINADLLEACKLALNAFENNWAIDWDILKKAIAKAEGGS